MKRILFAAGILVCFAFASLRAVDVPFERPPGPPLFGGTYPVFTNILTLVQPSVTNFSHQPIDVPSGHVLAVAVTLVGATASVSNVVAFWNTSLDGINWTTTYAISNSFAVNGTAPHRQVVGVVTNALGRFISLDKFQSDTLTNILLTNFNYTLIPSR